MNLDTINSPIDLILQNEVEPTEEKSKVDTILEEDLNLEETYTLTLSLIQRLGGFHQSVIEQLKEEGDTDRLVVWCQDEQLIHSSYDMIKEVSDNN